MVFCLWFPGGFRFPRFPVAVLFRFAVLWGVLWLFPLLLLLRLSGLLASLLPLGAVAPLAFRSVLPACLGPVSWRWLGFRRSPLLLAFPGLGVRALALAFAPSARFLLRRACRPRGVFLFLSPRRPPWFGVAVRRVALRPCSPLVVAFRFPWALSPVSSLPLLPVAAPVAVVGFSGGRRLSPAFRPLVAGVVGAVLAGGRSVAVGCAGGADLFVRSAAPGAVVFAVPGSGCRPGSWFAARSVALVRAVAAGGPGSGFVVFPAAPCPCGLAPSSLALACFCGSGSGSWASAAFAAGLGLPLVVFPCGFSALPPWGRWVPAGAGAWSGGFRLAGA